MAKATKKSGTTAVAVAEQVEQTATTAAETPPADPPADQPPPQPQPTDDSGAEKKSAREEKGIDLFDRGELYDRYFDLPPGGVGVSGRHPLVNYFWRPVLRQVVNFLGKPVYPELFDVLMGEDVVQKCHYCKPFMGVRVMFFNLKRLDMAIDAARGGAELMQDRELSVFQRQSVELGFDPTKVTETPVTVDSLAKTGLLPQTPCVELLPDLEKLAPFMIPVDKVGTPKVSGNCFVDKEGVPLWLCGAFYWGEKSQNGRTFYQENDREDVHYVRGRNRMRQELSGRLFNCATCTLESTRRALVDFVTGVKDRFTQTQAADQSLQDRMRFDLRNKLRNKYRGK